jgi:hypothetical protein
MIMDAQRLRNLTTGRLHTDVGHIYQDMEYLTGMTGLMTHMLPNVMRALEPWLKLKVTEARFWDGKLDLSHQGDFDIRPMSEQEQKEVGDRYIKLPHPSSN